jgi:hypothetical protein
VLRARSPVRVENVQIIVEISKGEDGRAVGTVRARGGSQARPFSGNLEFLALIESLYRIGADTAGPAAGPSVKEWS